MKPIPLVIISRARKYGRMISHVLERKEYIDERKVAAQYNLHGWRVTCECETVE